MRLFLIVIFSMLMSVYAFAANGLDVRKRMDQDIRSGKPLVAHLLVALADNKYQGIVPTTPTLGNGQNTRSNLYWGAMYGVDSFMPGKGKWKRLKVLTSPDMPILKRSVFHKYIYRKGKKVSAYIVADAWDGRYIHQTTSKFFQYGTEVNAEAIHIRQGKNRVKIEAGGKAHLIGFIGHNAYLDIFPFNKSAMHASSSNLKSDLPKAAFVLACQSSRYFAERLRARNIHPLVLTKGNMAPEAYTVDALIKSWFAGKSEKQVLLSAAHAYKKYQKIGLKAARWLFTGG